MGLYRVTLTGADRSVNPKDLVKVWETFPFVEWGILIGSSFGGTRFPSRMWIEQVIEERFRTDNKMPLALHVCGDRLRCIQMGRPDLLAMFGAKLSAFSRVQLNWHGEVQPPGTAERLLAAFCLMDVGGWDPEIILQLDGVNDEIGHALSRRFRVSGLFDQSHGAGVMPDEWPAPRSDMMCGYAGGLGPGSIVHQLGRIQGVVRPDRPFWIDMETRLFNDKYEFDLDRCRLVLESAREFVSTPANCN